MNRDEVLDVLVSELTSWPAFIVQTRHVEIDGWDWRKDNKGDLCFCNNSYEPIEKHNWNAARLEIVEDQSIENSSGDINDEDINTDHPPSKYHVRNIWQDEEWLDFYTVWDAIKLGKNYQVGDSAIEHAIKKGFAIGERSGGKSRVQDLKEMIWSLERAVELIEAQE